MQDARATQLTAEQLEELSQDPKNKVLRETHETEHEPWDPSQLDQMLRALHGAFVAHAVATPAATIDEDESAAVRIVRAGGPEMIKMAQQHPSLVGKITTRSSALDAKQMTMVWLMVQLRCSVADGAMSAEDAQRDLVAKTLPHFFDGAKKSGKQSSATATTK